MCLRNMEDSGITYLAFVIDCSYLFANCSYLFTSHLYCEPLIQDVSKVTDTTLRVDWRPFLTVLDAL